MTEHSGSQTVNSDELEDSRKSPARALLLSALAPGWGQLYNRQLDKAVLLWIWTAILAAIGVALGLLGMLGRIMPRSVARPPLGDWIADHSGAVILGWLLVWMVLWVLNVRDAYLTAQALNRGDVVIRYSLRRQMVHVLASQVLGFIPWVGMFFPPSVVAEAMDAVRHRRAPDRSRLMREGAQALAEWAFTRLAIYALWIVLAVWALWWLLRAFGLPI